MAAYNTNCSRVRTPLVFPRKNVFESIRYSQLKTRFLNSNISEVYPGHQRHLRARGDDLLPRPQVLLPPRALPLPGRPGAAHGGDGQAHERAQHVAHLRADFQVSFSFYFRCFCAKLFFFVSAISKRKGRNKNYLS